MERNLQTGGFDQHQTQPAKRQITHFGLKALAHGINPDVDIVAIHGIDGDREGSWTTDNGVLWLRDLLPTKIPNARILTYGYDANTHGREQLANDYMHGHAMTFISKLVLFREESSTSDRPIIFIAHSSGGILLKSALIHSHLAHNGHLKHHHTISQSTYGVTFFSTPHQGSATAELARFLLDMGSPSIPTSTVLLQHLERDSEGLQQQLALYAAISSQYETKFFYELYDTAVVGSVSKRVVSKSSAVVPGAVNAEAICICKDHVNMVKYGSADDEDFRTVATTLSLMSKAACRTMQESRTSTEVKEIVLTQEWVLLDKLPLAHSARYDPSCCCMEGTRTKILQDIIDWTTQSTGSGLLWLYGTAGSGKTSIATSTAREMQKRNMLGATFFCSRDKPELRDPSFVLPTIAARLAILFPAFGKAVADQLRRDPHIGRSAMQFQFEGLFALPVKQIGAIDIAARATPLIIVIDALDECGSTETRKTLLRYLLELSGLTIWLKVVATSRPEPEIKRLFKSKSCVSFHLQLNDDATFNDILLFTRARMTEIAENDELQPPDWPGAVRSKQLAERAGGLFIWAQTASLFIGKGQDPEKRLQLILSMGSPPGAYAKLDALYTTALMSAFGNLDKDDLEIFQGVVGTIVTSLTPLPIPAICDLLNGSISLAAIRKLVRKLGSVLYEDEQNESVVRVCHLSFIDFITDTSRCHPQFFIDLHQHHTALATVSLQIMRDRLRFNICNLESSDIFNDQVPDMAIRVRDVIPISLKYSSVHWMSHLHDSLKEAPLIEALEGFLDQMSVLFWIEALSIMGEILAAIHGLPLVVRWFEDPDNANSLFIADIRRFILAFKEPITRSTPHLYISALPLAPTQSLVSKRFLPLFPNTFCLDDRESLWSPCLQTLERHSDRVFAVRWSPDGQWLVSSSSDNSIGIWNSTTGAMMQRLRGHSKTLSSVSVSPNSRLVASSPSDMLIQIWDIETGVPILPPLLGHTDAIYHIIFSPDGIHLASCSADKTIRIWDVTSGKLVLDPLTGHTDQVWAIAYSPDGTRLVSCSRDETLRMWDVRTGHTVLGPLTVHTSDVYTVDFSPNGRRIISGSRDGSIIILDSTSGIILLGPLQVGATVEVAKFSPDGRLILSTSYDSTIRIWDGESGIELCNQRHSGSILSACFSPDGQHFVTGSSDRTVQIWELSSLSPSAPSGSDSWHTDLIRSVAFSPDGKYIVSGSRDETVCVWHSDTGAPACAPLRGHTSDVMAVTFSPLSQHLLSASWDKTLRLWEVPTWQSTMEAFSGHTGPIMCAVFSPDGGFIVSGSRDRTIRLWNPSTGKEICEPLRGHQGSVFALAISSDGHLIASSSEDETVKIWDSTSKQNRFSLFIGEGDVCSIGFSPDSQYITSYSGQGYVSSLDIQQQVVLWSYSFPSVGPGSCIFSRNGQYIFCSSVSLLFILDAKTSSAIRTPFKGHSTFIYSLAISPNGKHLISGSGDRTIRAWDIEFEGDEAHQELLPDAQRLSEPVGDDGWVRLPTGDPLLWIPTQYRDGLWKRTLFSIPPTASNHPRAMDCSRFRHGNAWTQVRGA